ncbi:DUF6220 domain-containing protein [Thalassobacillus devorans]|uniref:DUF6220 domain-containing protein n=1 Tax=Thalassobacillus devorans TaxID=279813 RepID=UPI000A1C7CB7|nr:DUF6220 domain-containing protein [Thalassobacillus devorans]
MKKIGRIIFIGLGALLLLCFMVQFILAGMAAFINFEYWKDHMFFVHLFGFNLPIIMLLTAFISKFPRKVYLQLAAIFGLTFLMYVTANISSLFPWVGALHPLFAVLLFLASIAILNTSFRLTFKRH